MPPDLASHHGLKSRWSCWLAVGTFGNLRCLARRSPDEMLKRAYALCGQMTHFFAQFRLYLTFEALEPAWLTMQNQIRSATSLDQAGHPMDMHAVCLRWGLCAAQHIFLTFTLDKLRTASVCPGCSQRKGHVRVDGMRSTCQHFACLKKANEHVHGPGYGGAQ